MSEREAAPRYGWCSNPSCDECATAPRQCRAGETDAACQPPRRIRFAGRLLEIPETEETARQAAHKARRGVRASTTPEDALERVKWSRLANFRVE